MSGFFAPGYSLRVALLRVVEGALGDGVLQGAHVLASELVVGNPLLAVVVFGSADEPHVADVDVDSGEVDLSDDAPAVDGLGDCVKQAGSKTNEILTTIQLSSRVQQSLVDTKSL